MVEGRVTDQSRCGVHIKIESATIQPGNAQVSSITCASTPPPTCATTPSTQTPAQNSNSETIAGILGAMVGLLVVLLALTNIGWVWTCYMNRRRKIIEQLNAR